MRHSTIYDLLKTAQPCSPIHSYRRTENQWRHYESMAAMPQGVVVLGDAACCFNPVYGQGMTAAALGAMTLDRCLAKLHSPRSLAWRQEPWERYFQKQLAQALKMPWLMATGEDFRWPSTERKRPGWMSQQLNKYIDRILDLSTESATIHRTFLEVSHLVKPPQVLFSPPILWRALTHR